jgi:type IV fimbrial biogenesis protein FimT
MSNTLGACHRANRSHLSQAGFTLVELLVTVAVLAVLMAIAVPSFTDYTRSQTLSARAGALHQDLVLARAEAVKLQLNVELDATGGDWTKGWSVYADANSNGKLDGGENILHTQDAFDVGYSMKAADGGGGSKAGIAFNSRGAVVGGGSANFLVCAPGWSKANDNGFAKNLRVLPSGRSEVGKGKGGGPGLTCT